MCVPEEILIDEGLPQRILQTEDEYRKNLKFCDFKVIANGFEIPVHRLVLASCSSYFDSLFSVNLKENTDGFVKLDEFPTDIIILLIEYMYTGKLKVSKNTIKHIFEASKYLGLEHPANVCAVILMNSISKKNALDIWRYGDKFSHELLLLTVKHFILQNAVDIFEMPNFKDFSFDEIHELISDDELNISEDELFTHVIGWIQVDIPNRSQYLPRLIEHFRIPIMKSNFVNKNILCNELILAEPDCMRYVMKLLKIFVGDMVTPPDLILSPKTRYRNGTTKKQIFIYNNQDGNLNIYNNLENECKRLQSKTVIEAEHGFACVNYNNNFFLSGVTDNTCVYYNPVFNTWHNFYPMKENRKFHRLICANESLYACGGKESNSVEIFHDSGQVWIDGPPMNKHRDNFGLVSVDQSIYAVGGSTSNDLEHFDERTGTWSILSDLPEAVCEAVAVDKSIYGINADGVGMFDIRNNKWQLLLNTPYPSGSSIKSAVAINGNIMFFVSIYHKVYNTRTAKHETRERMNAFEYNTTSETWIEHGNLNNCCGSLGAVVLSWQN